MLSKKTKDKEKVATLSAALLGQTVGKTSFQILDFISKGAFGALFRGTDQMTGQAVAIKVEPKTAPRPQLHLEFRFYQILGSRHGIPQIYFLGPVGEFNALVMELLGPSMASMLTKCGGTFSLRTTIQITIQLISLYSYIHSCGILYRDTKPENFCIGLENTERWWIIYVIDMGFCKQYRLEDGSHIPYQEGKFITGTVRYISINNHLGREQSRRDDLEALAYMLVYLYKGALPWMNIKADKVGEKYMKIGICKMETDVKVLCDGMPEEFSEYLSGVKALKFEEEPDYNRYGKSFINLLAKRYGLELSDRVYDWNWSHDIKSELLRSF